MNGEIIKPVKEGDVIDITIEGIGAKGDGIGKVDNFVVIVPGAKEGETVKVRITRVLRKMAFAELADGDGGEAPAEEPAEETHEEEAAEEPAVEEAHEEEASTEEE